MVRADRLQNFCRWSLGCSRAPLADSVLYFIARFTRPEAELHVLVSILMNEVWYTDGEKVNIFQSQASEIHKLFINYFNVLCSGQGQFLIWKQELFNHTLPLNRKRLALNAAQ